MAKSPPLSATIERFGLVGQNMFGFVLSITTGSDNNKTCTLLLYFLHEDNNRSVFTQVFMGSVSSRQRPVEIIIQYSWRPET